MPSNQDIEKAKTRREQRKAAREAAVVMAHAQEAAMSETIAEQKEEAKANPKPVAPRAPTKTRKEQVRDARAAAEKKAAEQEKLVTSRRVDPSPYLKASYDAPPLHVLNQMAQDAQIPIRREAREIANAAGKAAFDMAINRASAHQGHKRMAKVNKALQARDEKPEDKPNEGGNGQ